MSGTVDSESGVIRFLSPFVRSEGIRVFTNSATLVLEAVVPTDRSRRVRNAVRHAAAPLNDRSAIHSSICRT